MKRRRKSMVIRKRRRQPGPRRSGPAAAAAKSGEKIRKHQLAKACGNIGVKAGSLGESEETLSAYVASGI